MAGSRQLDVWSSGDDPKKALDRAQEAILAFLNDAEERGTIGQVLSAAGVRVQTKKVANPEPSFERFLDSFKPEYSFPLSFPVSEPVPEHCVD